MARTTPLFSRGLLFTLLFSLVVLDLSACSSPST
jgi:hypothetical protein